MIFEMEWGWWGGSGWAVFPFYCYSKFDLKRWLPSKKKSYVWLNKTQNDCLTFTIRCVSILSGIFLSCLGNGGMFCSLPYEMLSLCSMLMMSLNCKTALSFYTRILINIHCRHSYLVPRNKEYTAVFVWFKEATSNSSCYSVCSYAPYCSEERGPQSPLSHMLHKELNLLLVSKLTWINHPTTVWNNH